LFNAVLGHRRFEIVVGHGLLHIGHKLAELL
jgi:hypothetical protein